MKRMNRKKQIIAILSAMVLMMVAVPLFAMYATSRPVTVNVNGERVVFPDHEPEMINNRVMVPVRGVFEHLGFTVTWNSESRMARLSRDGLIIVIPADAGAFTVGPNIITPDVPQQIRNNRMLLPLRAIAEAIGGEAEWDGQNRVAIITGGVPQPTPSPMPSPTPHPEWSTPEPPDPWATPTPPPPWETPAPETPSPQQTPTPTPDPTPAPTIDPYATPAPTLPPSGFEPDPDDPRQQPFIDTTSSIQIPNRRLEIDERTQWVREYIYMGGASAFEQEVIYLVNQRRADHGLEPFEVDETLMHAARFYSQTMANLNLSLGQNVGPYVYGNMVAAYNSATAFGARLRFNGGIGNMGGWTAQGIVTAWMNSTTHRNFILHPTHNYVGFGSHLGGPRGVFHFMYISVYPSEPVVTID